MDHERLILGKLLAKYENSAHYRETASVGRRVLLKLGPQSRDLKEYDIEQVEQKESIHAAVRRLAGDGLIGFEWERFNQGNVLATVWLNLEKIAEAYARLGLTPKRETVDSILTMIGELLTDEATAPAVPLSAVDPGLRGEPAEPSNRQWILPALHDMQERIRSSGRLTPLLPEDPDLARDVLTALRELLKAGFSETYIRVFSLLCYQDSKTFEKKVRSRLLLLVRRYHPLLVESAEGESDGDEDLMALIGLFRNPEIYEFCGPVRMTFGSPSKDSAEQTIGYAVFRQGACLHSASVKDLTSVDTSRVHRLLFIENRTSYDAYIRSEHAADELVVYHGGFHGPTKLRFFRALADALAAQVAIQHWGDIDLGGLRIFLKIRQSIAPSLQPWRMDRATLMVLKEKAVPFSTSYRKALERSLSDPQFTDFQDLIRAMLETGLRLEQEAFI